jgi:hypothetical protein
MSRIKSESSVMPPTVLALMLVSALALVPPPVLALASALILVSSAGTSIGDDDRC